MERALFHPSWLWFSVRSYGNTLNELDLFHSWFVYECPRSSKWYYMNFPKLLNFILDFLQESGERHLHHRPSSWLANLTWFWLVFLLQRLILICCFITNTSRKFRPAKGFHHILKVWNFKSVRETTEIAVDFPGISEPFGLRLVYAWGHWWCYQGAAKLWTRGSQHGGAGMKSISHWFKIDRFG